jgi:hypothetical protein
MSEEVEPEENNKEKALVTDDLNWEIPEHEYEYIKLSIWDVVFNEKNPRIHGTDEYARLRRSYERFGAGADPIVDQDNVLVAGHARVASLRQNPPKNPVIIFKRIKYPDEATRDGYMVTDNRTSQFSQWDQDKTYQLVTELIEKGVKPLDMAFYEVDMESLKAANAQIDTTGLTGVDARAGLADIRVVKLFFDKEQNYEEYNWFTNHYDITTSGSKVDQTQEFIKYLIALEEFVQSDESDKPKPTYKKPKAKGKTKSKAKSTEPEAEAQEGSEA